jgi:hypothetical protein
VKHFIIVGTQRIGSTPMGESLDFRPRIACGGEWTLAVSWYLKPQVAEPNICRRFFILLQRQQADAARMMIGRIVWLGFKVLSRSSGEWLVHPRIAPALWLDRLKGYIASLARRPEIRVMHIVRCDNVAGLQSRPLSSKSGLYNTKSCLPGCEWPFQQTPACDPRSGSIYR